ncbi:hypothetical protein GYMLUDRAFT_64073 [Collybiopsis luxurians FD-317 M1]|uniref:Uncharacterized protein n=1 Tax=Collybiopsis luxurians FD-317 M1 TaxID=944289 RepID=A0A0D0AQU1_9AGAR|nr:hypothetical protein GYMLUDRAFT_64073 [Collybiopsis luxurians FD-317 M1]
MAVIKRAEFWEALKRIVNHLEPLAIAANIIQAAHCCLDQVLVTFGYLFLQYLRMNVTDCCGCDAIIASIESRWQKADQELFVAAVLLNPVYQNLPFSWISAFNLAGIQNLLMQIWDCFFPAERLNLEFLNHLDDYFHNQGFFAHLPSRVTLELGNAMTNVGDQSIACDSMLTELYSNEQLIQFKYIEDFYFLVYKVPSLSALPFRYSAFQQIQLPASDYSVSLLNSSSHLKRRFEARGKRANAELEGQTMLGSSPAIPLPASGTNLSANLEDGYINGDHQSNTTFCSMMEKNMQAIAQDETDNLPVVSTDLTFTSSFSLVSGIPIHELFDFSNDQWINIYICRSRDAVHEEMQLYEMLEKENIGDEGGLVDLDETNEDLLQN